MAIVAKMRRRLSFYRCVMKASSAGDREVIGSLKDAISRTIFGSDEALFGLIEARRSELESNSSVVEFVDFGAGTGRPGEKTVSHLARASKDKNWGRLLYRICKSINAKSSLELGTCVGISGSYIAGGSIALTSIEGDPTLGKISQTTFEQVNVTARCEIGPFTEVLPKVLPQIKPIDFAFIDGHHDGQATIEYFDAIKPFLAERAIVIFDDIAWSDSMAEAWHKIRDDQRTWMDLRQIGIVAL